MVQIDWTEEAVDKLESIRRYIRQFNPVAAERVVARLVTAGNSLDLFPYRGRPTEIGHRELPTVRPYVITYAVAEHGGITVVTILSIRHGAQLPSD